MELAAHDICTGCGACAKACPRQAIAYRDDDEGFPTPYIQKDKCIECGICNKVCPALNMPKTNSIQASYAAQALDREMLKDSTSGGLFTVFAREIFRRNGVVFGCVWDEQYNAVVKGATNEEETKPMRGSKYVWSWAGDAFPEVKKYLDDGRVVMFVGLPCQVAGLKNFLRKDYENLFLVDLFCGGSPSPLAFREYLKTITVKVPLDKLNFKFRDKEKFGVGVHISYQGENGRIHQSYVRNPYFFSYHTKVFHRLPCYHCQYRYVHRVEDITIGDYWEVGRFHKEFDIKAGVSSLLVNSNKGLQLLDSVKDQLQLSVTKLEDIAYWNNLTLGDQQKVFNAPGFRKDFFTVLRTRGWKTAERRYLYNKARLRLWIKGIIPARYIPLLRKLISH